MLRFHRAGILAIMAGCVGLGHETTEAAYTFTKIDERPVHLQYDPEASINASGLVTFSTQGGAIFIGDGNTVTTIAESSPSTPYNFVRGLSTNAHGVVAFGANLRAGGQGIFTSDGQTTNTIVTTGGQFTGLRGFHPSINDAGVVSFGADLSNGEQGVFTAHNGSLTPIADTSGPLLGFYADLEHGINASGTVAFQARLDAGGEGVFTGNGGGLTTIADSSGPYDLIAFYPEINDAGVTVFGSILDSGVYGLFTSEAGTVTPITDDTGPYSGFLAPAINNLGDTAFYASLDAGGFGVFVGPDPVNDKVIAQGDTLFGSEVTELGFAHHALNDAGQLAFWAALADGRDVIVRADPPALVPEPSSLLLLGLAWVGWTKRRHPQ